MSKQRSRKKLYMCLFFACMLVIVAGCFLFVPQLLSKSKLKEPAGIYMDITDANACLQQLANHSDGQIEIPLVEGYHQSFCLKDLTVIENCLLNDAFSTSFQSCFENVKKTQKGENSRILASDFFDAYQKLWNEFCPNQELIHVNMVCIDDQQLEFAVISEADLGVALSDISVYTICDQQSDRLMEMYAVHHVNAYLTCNNIIICNTNKYFENDDSKPNDSFYLKGCFIKSNIGLDMELCFGTTKYKVLKDQDNLLTTEGTKYTGFEDVADVYFVDGMAHEVSVYQSKVSGKLLSVSDENIELDQGIFGCPENIPVYKVYGEAEDYTESDLKIGYDFTDFILDDENHVVAALVAREEKMDKIRVLIKTSNYEDRFHDSLTFSCSDSVSVNGITYEAGKEITLSSNDEIFDQGRVFITPSTNTSRTTFQSIDRANGKPAYRGSFEVAKTNDGLVLINELSLEEYLYAVVPSEMPAYYENEALMSQAICARTYAYMHMAKSKLKEYGAHVDDSTSFQVYHNTDECEATTLAIRNTQGIVMKYQGKLAEAYYYSTSCGFGTNIGVWHSNTDGFEYMKSKHLNTMYLDHLDDSLDMTNEEVFRNYIDQVDNKDYEVQEGWYRWTYETELDVEILNEHINRRYEANASLILTKVDDAFVSKSPLVFSEIYDIQVVKRLDGGAIDELLIEGKEGTMKIVGEFAARAVLANASDSLTRQNGSTNSVTTLLPSSFAYVDVTTDENGIVTGFLVHGGGYGHGIGMSQNGANHMAKEGLDHNQILQFFYEGIMLESL